MTAQILKLPLKPRQIWPPPSNTSFDGCDVADLRDHPLRRDVLGSFSTDTEPGGDDA